MNSLRHRLPSLLNLLILCLALLGCTKPTADPKKQNGVLTDLLGRKPKEKSYPFEMAMKDRQGRTLEATIVGRSKDALFVIRAGDGLKADVAISSLSPSDAEFAVSLPLKEAPAGFRDGMETERKILKDPYIQSREDQIARLKNQNERLERDIQSTSNEMMTRNWRSQINRNSQEILKMESDIQTYKESHRTDKPDRATTKPAP